MSTEQRREQLVQLGLDVFGHHAYDEVSVEQLARQAGASAGLLYHYFPSKKAYYLAVMRVAVDQIYSATTAPPNTAAEDALRLGVDAYLAHAAAHPMGFLTAHRGALAIDPDVQRLSTRAQQRQADRILILLGLPRDRTTAAHAAVVGWTAMVREATANWLLTAHPSRDAVSRLLVGALQGALAATH
jgi:AcrR family transcriptional regulator